jgi:hypothetical protein
MKKALFVIGSACWFLFAVGFAGLVLQYVLQGAGFEFSVWMFSSSGVLIGTVHVAGLALASLGCLAVSAGLWAKAFVPAEGWTNDSDKPSD